MDLEPWQTKGLEHLVRICSTPACEAAWTEYARWKAGAMAAKNPDRWAWLPMRLDASLPKQSGSLAGKPAALRQTATRAGMHAPTYTNPLRARNGRPFSS